MSGGGQRLEVALSSKIRLTMFQFDLLLHWLRFNYSAISFN